MIKPSIGRVVWFWHNAIIAQHEGAQPNAAIVTYVHHDELVNLTVFSEVGYPGAYQHIPLWQGEGERPQGMHCEWMPYQKGQAAKAEAPPMEIFAKVETLLNKVAMLEAVLAGNGKAAQSNATTGVSAAVTPPLPPK